MYMYMYSMISSFTHLYSIVSPLQITQANVWYSGCVTISVGPQFTTSLYCAVQVRFMPRNLLRESLQNI